MSLRVSLFEYPIKGGRGIRRNEMVFDRRGPSIDRRWMVVEPSGEKVTQRECPQLARLCTRGFDRSVTPTAIGELWFGDDIADSMQLLLNPAASTGRVIEVNVWGDKCMAVTGHPMINRWLSERLGREVLLVKMLNDFQRLSRGRTVGHTVLNGFADGYPLLITTEASLTELNRRLQTPVPMDRFRPNIVIHGDLEPFVEDSWEGKILFIGDITVMMQKPCARCVVITTEQKIGERMKGEPLKTLGKFRKFGNEVRFGMNADHLNEGVIHAGDAVEFRD